MKKQENKKFGFEKFELAKLSVLKKIKGGEIVMRRGEFHDPGTVTDIIDAVKSVFCDKKD